MPITLTCRSSLCWTCVHALRSRRGLCGTVPHGVSLGRKQFEEQVSVVTWLLKFSLKDRSQTVGKVFLMTREFSETEAEYIF